ncbi:WbqC family protein [Enterovibrio makurazakiensis]|uniref:WbqC family protein n=1 Tax=Enterovibrio makurazakiensis TaxID=2910232 RepID=UPI003D1E68BC
MNKKIAISQSNYIPWKGYFDMIAYVDEFILYDDMQYTKRDWRNRNQVKTPSGSQWITIPVKVKGKYFQKINETEIDSDAWVRKHWGTIVQNYKKAPYYDEVKSVLEPLYMDVKHYNLSQCNRKFIVAICEYLSIGTKILDSSDYDLVDGKSEKLLSICMQANASEYVSGPSARGYLDEKLFLDAGVKVTWFDYNDYPEYPQQWKGFEHYLSIIDLLFNNGKDSKEYMKYVNKKGALL